MSINAISAQGSTLEISAGSGTAINVSAVSLTYPCRVTFAASIATISEGQQITFASVGGTTQLNGNTYVAQYVDQTNRIVTLADVDARAFTAYTSGGTGTPVTYSTIGDVISYSGLDGMASELDTTDLSSEAKEFKLGLVDNGGFQIEMNRVGTNVGQQALDAARTNGTVRGFRLTLPNGEVATFNALCKKKDIRGGVDQISRSAAELRITGPVTWS